VNNVKIVFYWLLAILIVLAIIFGLNYAGYLGDIFFAPRQEAIRHEVNECSQTHEGGLVRELRQYQDQFYKASKDGDQAGEKVVADRYKQEYDEYTCNSIPLPPDVQSFRETIR
jgi:hypothetical protein